MTSIIYEAEIDLKLEPLWLNGQEGALEVFANETAWDEAEGVAVFENASAAYDFIDQLEAKLSDAGLHRADDQ